MRIALETSITRFVRSGLAVYARNLQRALVAAGDDIQLIPLSIPERFADAPHPLVQKLYAAYWQIVHAHIVLPRQARQLGCDLLHCTMTMPLPERMPCPVVVTVHDLIPFVHPEWVQPLRGRRMRHGIRVSVQRATHLLADSEATRRDVLRQFGVAESGVTTVLLGADTQLPAIAAVDAAQAIGARFGLDPGYVLSVGSIEPRKNVGRVISAYARLRRPGVPPLVIVGQSLFRQQQLARQIEQAGLDDAVICTGHVTGDELAALLRCAGVFVYPSLYEGFGLPPLEAMQLGCPVITSNVSSLPEVVGSAALTVDPYNVDQLAGAIEQVLIDTDLAEHLRATGLEHVKRFTWRRCAADTIDVYRNVLTGWEPR